MLTQDASAVLPHEKKPTAEQVEALAEAMWYVLDDMRATGHSVCGYTKAVARVAYEPFLQADFAADPALGADYAPDMTFEAAKALISDVDRDTSCQHADLTTARAKVKPKGDRHRIAAGD